MQWNTKSVLVRHSSLGWAWRAASVGAVGTQGVLLGTGGVVERQGPGSCRVRTLITRMGMKSAIGSPRDPKGVHATANRGDTGGVARQDRGRAWPSTHHQDRHAEPSGPQDGHEEPHRDCGSMGQAASGVWRTTHGHVRADRHSSPGWDRPHKCSPARSRKGRPSVRESARVHARRRYLSPIM